MARRRRGHARDRRGRRGRGRLGLALSGCLLAALCGRGAARAAAEEPLAWPRWEAGGQLSLVAAGGEVALRVQGTAGRYLGRHLLELRCGASHLLAATAVDLDAGYALHLRWRALLAFARAGVGARFEHVGGGGARARVAVIGGAGLKLVAARHVALRVDLEYRYVGGAPGVADELALLVGPAVLW